MKVRIICKENINTWILGKFAMKMQENLRELGHTCDIAYEEDESADVNHHIIYFYPNRELPGIQTMMITHVDELIKLNVINNQISKNILGICMSNDTMQWLYKMGVDKSKLCFVDPAHDESALIKRYKIGIASRVYPDGRKNETYFDRLAEELDSKYFHFKFMGAGWEKQVEHLRSKGFEVTYHDRFIRKKYYKFIQSLDYYLYTGSDEGQMGFVDAAAAGVKTIVTPQGYHLDAPDALTYSFRTYDELRDILLGLQKERQNIIRTMDDWTWKAYTIKHIELWEYMMGKKVRSKYRDGLNSYLRLQNSNDIVDEAFIIAEKKRLEEITNLHNKNVDTYYAPKNFMERIEDKIRRCFNKQIY